MAMVKGKCVVFLLKLPVMLTLLLLSRRVVSLTDCQRGTFQLMVNDGLHVCELCEDGTFMPYHDHKYKECFQCTEVQDESLETLIRYCNRTHDSVIHCANGYYRRLPRNIREKERCEKCTECRYPTLPCRTYDDTHCCFGENFEVVLDKQHGIPTCVEKPWLCRQGELFDVYTFQCLECPSGTFMPLDYHSMTECLKCHSSYWENLPKHVIFMQHCNSTHHAVLECEDGFYFSHNMGLYNQDIGCSPCKSCSLADGIYEGRECGRAHDTVCCPQPNMTVVDTSEGLECRPVFTVSDLTIVTPEKPVCGKDEYLYMDDDNNKQPATCRPCLPGTFMDELNHTRSACKNCAEVQGQPAPSSCPSVKTDGKHNRTKSGAQNDTNDAWLALMGILFFCLGSFLTSVVLGLLARRYPVIIKRFLRYCTRRHYLLVEFGTGEGDTMLQPIEIISTWGRHEIYCSSDPVLTRQQNCQNNIKHQEYVTVADFNEQHLPGGWDFLVPYIKAVADLTVRLSVTNQSDDRPQGYPLHGQKGTTYGSGMVWFMSRKFAKKDGRTCPCRKCENSPNTAVTQWGQVEVITAKHVVFNDEECRGTVCDFGFERDNIQKTCPKLDVVRCRYSTFEKDACILQCVTHKKDVSDVLEKKNQLWRELRERESNAKNLMPLAVIISHPHGRSKRISVGQLKKREKEPPYKFIYSTQTCEGSGGAPVCILGETGTSFDTITIHRARKENGERQSSGFVLW